MFRSIINRTFVAQVFILLVIFSLYFGRLFYPEPSIFFTPEIGRSDIWHFNYPVKDFLARSLKNGELPLWNNMAGNGFPFLAEGQIGTFNLTNLMLFSIFPTWLAFNLSYVVIFSTAFAGTYLFLKKLKFGDFISFISAFIFSFGGFFITHIHHFALIQTASFLPWVFLTAFMYWGKQTKTNFRFFVFVLIQQFFSGHFQIFLITTVTLFIFLVIYHSKMKPDEMLKILLSTLMVFSFAMILSAVQLFPTLELLSQSVRVGIVSINDNLGIHSIKQLIHLIKPYYFGSPSDGTYPSENLDLLGIFWENNSYLGILPLVVTVFAFLKKKKTRLEKSLIVLILISLIMTFGKNSPFIFIFLLPVFSSLRVPNRFFLVFSFSVVILTALQLRGINFLEKRTKKIFEVIFGAIVFFDLFIFGANFHPVASVDKLLSRPQTAESIPINSRILTHFSHKESYFRQFLDNGWTEIDPYIYFRNGLDENSNLTFNYGNIQVYSAIPLIRHYHLEKNITMNFVNASGVDYIVSTQDLDGIENLNLVNKINSPSNNLPNYFIYENQGALNRFRFVTDYEVFNVAVNRPEFKLDDDIGFETTVVLEENIARKFNELNEQEIEVLEDKSTKILLDTYTDTESLMVIADTYYPGWVVKINGKKTKIFPANVSQRAIIVPEGKNIIEFKYVPYSLYLGILVSLVGLCAMLLGDKYFVKFGLFESY